ncbi:hypothetical protein AB1283_02270 [Bacillus sp. S13(2024)]
MSNQEKIKEIKDLLPVHFSSFDILYLNGESLINKPLSERLDTLNTIVENTRIYLLVLLIQTVMNFITE